MIELTTLTIKTENDIISSRNKLYRLALDLEVKTNIATQISTLFSELLNQVLAAQNQSASQFVFRKNMGYYYLHVLIKCNEDSYQQFSNTEFSHNFNFHEENNGEGIIDLSLKITNNEFKPTQDFLQEERERLIQQSSSEMMHEIRNKNEELKKALQDLKASSNMIQVEKMRALGSMTAGVAHELNNPMMGILNFVQYAIKHTDEDDRRYRPLVDAEREVKRCQDIITNLLTFSRMKAEGEEDYSVIKLSEICERIIKLQAYKIRSFNVEIKTHFPDDEPKVSIKVNKVQQVILNLITNAIDAMKELEERELNLTIEIIDSTISLSVKDSGTGIDEETLDKIFEPFFTTKKTGQGTGLGLAVSQSIMEEHGGKLECTSIVGKGTNFIITLPIK